VEGRTAEVLVRAARGADLLVVGNRGHGGFTASLLGSVSHYCVHHASCPVLVMRGSGERKR
jgi:nucleotide-binding universal stress UspA family protein